MVHVGLLRVEVALGEGNSLKDKRHVIKSTLDTVRDRFNVSAAEVGFLDSLRRAEMAFSIVCNDRARANAILDKVLDHIERDPRISVTEADIEFL
ncbi:MAG: DUF503 domain-containing protein [Armatimonadetes bacterium]|nr:DUF503 domain-containing protein [Armatimonadota bacterium]